MTFSSFTEELTHFARNEAKPDAPELTPVDAATLLILKEDEQGTIRVLMGKRHMRHRFMPGKFVFPGGRVDDSDSQTCIHKHYAQELRQRLAKHAPDRSAAQLNALAVAAIRETYEEAGIFIGEKTAGENLELNQPELKAFADRNIAISLEPISFIARAITPPGQPRCFDTRFFAVWESSICDQLAQGTGPSGELEELQWPSLQQALELDLPPITKVILHELIERLKTDPSLEPQTPVPFYHWQDEFIRELI
ncbi:NUDIX hydrolase [Polycladidibacter stylochi]|uniref:NUDIX hydrolase n=1 Tax=Polycladidibacter stylochi TaxID=1807766 RepID=UPI0008362088|nr:NUDIX hydrolase [Pseudovibrio stylochi]